jgi:hypothetical protein
MQMKKTQTLPTSPKEWLREIRLAMEDARDTKPIAAMMGTKLTETELFHLAPLVCFKFRGKNLPKKEQDKLVKRALANYIANEERGLEASPEMAFALCYVAAHFVMDIISEDDAQEILAYCEEHLA